MGIRLFKCRKPERRIDISALRAVGAEYRAVAARQDVIHAQIEQLCRRLESELQNADPTTELGQSIEQAFIELSRISARTNAHEDLRRVADFLVAIPDAPEIVRAIRSNAAAGSVFAPLDDAEVNHA